MKLQRIKAIYTENPEEFFIFTLLTDNQDNIITNTEMFGYVVDDGNVYPFIIHATQRRDFLTLKYGADSEYATSKINLPKVKLKVGEYFTRFDDDSEDQYSYKIEHLTEIIKNTS